MANIIRKSRNQGNNSTPVKVALFDANIKDADWDSIKSYPITNLVETVNGFKGVRSTMGGIVEFSDIQGCRVGMIASQGGNIYRDIVTIVGRTNADIVIKFDDDNTEYSVTASMVRFVKGVE